MPINPLIIPALISAAGSLGGAAVGSRSARKAAELEAASQSDQLRYLRKQSALEQQRWEEEQRVNAEQWAAQQALREPFLRGAYSVLAKYGIAPPTMPEYGGEGASQGAKSLRYLSELTPEAKATYDAKGSSLVTPALTAPRALTLRDISSGAWRG